MRKFLSQLDWLIVLPVAVLITLGIFMILSTSIGESSPFVIRQVLYALIGLVLLCIALFLGYRLLLSWAPLLYLILIVLLLVTFVLGVETRGSTRWIDLGILTLQASELAKPILILTLVALVGAFPPIKATNVALSAGAVLLPTLLVFAQPDLGTAILLILIWLTVIYVGGISWKYLISLILIGLIFLPVGFSLLKGYQRTRLLSFLNPAADPLGSGYNLVQSVIAVGSGQFLGLGFGRGTQSHLNFLPEQKTDFIFATTGEELGFVGILIIFALFALIIWRIITIARTTQSKSGALICYAVAAVLAAQLFINAGMNMGILPVTGITLPFMSFGGSSLVSMLILVGFALSVKIKTDRREDNDHF